MTNWASHWEHVVKTRQTERMAVAGIEDFAVSIGHCRGLLWGLKYVPRAKTQEMSQGSSFGREKGAWASKIRTKHFGAIGSRWSAGVLEEGALWLNR